MQPEQRLNHDKYKQLLLSRGRLYHSERDYNPDIPVTANEMLLFELCLDLLDEIAYIRKEQDAMKQLYLYEKGN